MFSSLKFVKLQVIFWRFILNIKFIFLVPFIIFLQISLLYGNDTKKFVLRTNEAITQAMLRDLQKIVNTELLVKFKQKNRVFIARPASNNRLSAKNGVAVSILKAGKVIGFGFASQSTIVGNTRVATDLALRKCNNEKPEELIVLLEITLAEKEVKNTNPFLFAKKIDYGRQGGRMVIGKKTLNLTASKTILSGQGLEKIVRKKISKEISPTNSNVIFEPSNKYYINNSVLALIFWGEEITKIYRNNKLFSISDVNRTSVKDALHLARHWYLKNKNDSNQFLSSINPLTNRVHQKGCGAEDRLYNNFALSGLAGVLGDKKLKKLTKDNLKILVENFYLSNPDKKIGYVKTKDGISLGAASAMLDAVIRTGEIIKYKEQIINLVHFLNFQRQKNGSYRSYMNKPLNVINREFQGQSQYALMRFYVMSKDIQVIKGVATSFNFYLSDFDKTLSLPAVPWHTSAYTLLYKYVKQRPIVDFIFKMNDLVVSIQKNKEMQAEDRKGIFLNLLGGKKNHAAETARYVSGLLDAFSVAKQIGDKERETRYLLAAVQGIRYLLQLQIRDRYDTWCMPSREKVLGGFRYSTSNYRIRLSNQAHCVVALCKSLAVLSEDDFRKARVKAGM